MLFRSDCYTKDSREYPPKAAVDWFFTRTDRFVLDPKVDQYLVGITRGGWLKRIR